MDIDDHGSARAALVAALDVVEAAAGERLERIVRIARQVFDVPFASVNVLDDDLVHVLSPNRTDAQPSGPAGWSSCQVTMQVARPTVVPDTALDPATASLPGVSRLGIRFSAGVPLTLPGGIPIGTLCIMDARPRGFSLHDEAALIDFGRWAERALAQGLRQDRLQEVVAALTPTPTVAGGYRITAVTVPYGDVSGDVHDWSVVDGHLSLTLADVMGKEQPAGLLAAGIRAALRQHRSVDAVTALAGAEPALSEDLVHASAFATLFHARVALDTGAVEMVDAGHGLAVHVVAAGGQRILRSHGLPLGLHPTGAPRTPGRIVLEPGDALVVASDGVLDLGDGTIDTLGDLALTFRRARSTESFLETVRLRAAERGEDDVTVVVLTRDGTGADPVA